MLELEPIHEGDKPILVGPTPIKSRPRRISRSPNRHLVRAASNTPEFGEIVNNWEMASNSSPQVSARALRKRARWLLQNDEYAIKASELLAANIIGSEGMMHMSQIRKRNGELDKVKNDLLEAEFSEWGLREYATVCGRFSFQGVQDIALKIGLFEGEVFIREIIDPNINKWGFALQILEADQIDETYNKYDESTNTTIVNGVEYNQYSRPIAYYLLRYHPEDRTRRPNNNRSQRIRVPADQIIHFYWPTRVSQFRGSSILNPVMAALWNLSEYRNAELMKNKFASLKMAAYEVSENTTKPFTGDEFDDEGNIVEFLEPGKIAINPPGWNLKPLDFTTNATNYKDFIKATLRGVSAGIGVPYNDLANDLEGVNYSSIRQGVIDARERYTRHQRHFRDVVLNRIYRDWLKVALLNKSLGKFTLMDFDLLNNFKFQGRAWAYIDPTKDYDAHEKALSMGAKTLNDICLEQGKDWEDQIEQRAKEIARIRELGIEDYVLLEGNKAPTEQPQDDATDQHTDTETKQLAAPNLNEEV